VRVASSTRPSGNPGSPCLPLPRASPLRTGTAPFSIGCPLAQRHGGAVTGGQRGDAAGVPTRRFLHKGKDSEPSEVSSAELIAFLEPLVTPARVQRIRQARAAFWLDLGRLWPAGRAWAPPAAHTAHRCPAGRQCAHVRDGARRGGTVGPGKPWSSMPSVRWCACAASACSVTCCPSCWLARA